MRHFPSEWLLDCKSTRWTFQISNSWMHTVKIRNFLGLSDLSGVLQTAELPNSETINSRRERRLAINKFFNYHRHALSSSTTTPSRSYSAPSRPSWSTKWYGYSERLSLPAKRSSFIRFILFIFSVFSTLTDISPLLQTKASAQTEI